MIKNPKEREAVRRYINRIEAEACRKQDKQVRDLADYAVLVGIRTACHRIEKHLCGKEPASKRKDKP